MRSRFLTIVLLIINVIDMKPACGFFIETRRSLQEEQEAINEDDYIKQMATKKLTKSNSAKTKSIAKSQSDDSPENVPSKKINSGVKGERAGKWKENFAILQEYEKQHGNADVPLDYEERSGVKLGRWLRAIQKAWSSGKLPEEKVAALKKIGVTMEGPGTKVVGELKDQKKEDKFDLFTAALSTFRKEKGSLKVSRDYITADGLKLGMWVASMIVKAKRGDLADDRVQQMRQLYAKLGFDFDQEVTKLKKTS